MKTYKTYLYFFYDESIGEENTSHQTLTKSYGEETETNGCWLGHCPHLTISQILNTCWSKEDVDIFVKENPECRNITFSIWREERKWGEKNWEHYCPLVEQRDKLLKELL
jgi:hypothetical protein